jgi:hypothetical protein
MRNRIKRFAAGLPAATFVELPAGPSPESISKDWPEKEKRRRRMAAAIALQQLAKGVGLIPSR